MRGKRSLKQKGKVRTVIPKLVTGKTQGNGGKTSDWYIREFAGELGVWFQAVDTRCKTLGLSRKKTVTYSEKRKEYLRKLEPIPEESSV